MSRSGAGTLAHKNFWPSPVGYNHRMPTLCIGLDIAWFGGAESDRTSQYDFLAAAMIGAAPKPIATRFIRIPLNDRDRLAKQTASSIETLIKEYRETQDVRRILLAVDAPLQTDQGLPVPPKIKSLRRCERYLSDCRKAIDRISGRSGGWHPNIQPGIPLAPRILALVEQLADTGFRPWTRTDSQSDRLIVEVFPAEAIWSAKRMNQYAEHLTAPVVKAYKSQGGARLLATQVRQLVETVLLDSMKQISGIPADWPRVVDALMNKILADTAWQMNGLFRGGKMLDDVVDSCICLATAISYATNNAHVWQDANYPDDGHIIGPGRFTVSNIATGNP